MRTILITMLLALVALSCSNDRSNQLVGKWTAASVVQNDRNLEVELDEIQFDFTSKGTYRFTSTLDYIEQGTFYMEGDKLITKDTLKGNINKTVIVEQLNADSLKLKMKNEAGWMSLAMSKE